MTEKEFFDELNRIKGFHLTANGLIRRFNPKIVGGHIACPVCAVANKKLHKNKYMLEAAKAGKYLGLDRALICRIVRCADNWVIRSSRDDAFRNKLKRACGICH